MAKAKAQHTRDGLSTDRHDYQLTEEEFESLGGNEPPTYDEMMENLESGWRTSYTAQNQRLYQGPQGVPSLDGDTAAIWLAVAERVGCRFLTIHWPDVHFPDFTAVPK